MKYIYVMRKFLLLMLLCSGLAGVSIANVPEGKRFVTLCIMIRTTPWEVSRDVKLHPRDEGSWHTLEGVKALREAFAKNNPDGRLTWGFTMNALEDQRANYKQIRDYVVACQKQYGDEVSYFPGYFPAMYLPRERVNREMSEAIQTISKMVGNGYRPKSIIGGFLSASNLQYLAEKEDIHVAHATIWSQHNIDGGGADGSPSYPFYPSREHFCKPAQGKEDFIDCVNLDGWTMDFLCARRSGQKGHEITGYNSRRGVGPIETYKGWGLDLGHREVMHTQSIHFDKGVELNGIGWVTNIWEAQMVHEFGQEFICEAMEMWVTDTKKRWPDVQFVSFGEFGTMWREKYKTNNDWNYRFVERGSGLGDSYNNLEIKWFMNKAFRLALLRDWHTKGSPAYVIDFTRYDLAAKEPADPTPGKPVRDWSLINVMNQKGLRPQDKPRQLQELEATDQQLVRKYYPELFVAGAPVQTATGFVYVDKNGNGKKDRQEAGIPNVAVSNGIQVVRTDKNGKYQLPAGNDNILFVIKPSGYALPVDDRMLPQFYYIHKPAGSPSNMRYPGVKPTGPLPEEVNFALIPQEEQPQFRALVFGDPQVYSDQDIAWFRKGILEEVKGVKNVAFGMSLGDLVGDNLHLFNNYKKEMSALGLTWFNMVGNHDLNFDKGLTDFLSDESYEAQFGPANYAFEYGNAHFIVLDDILAPDPRKNSGYWGGLRPDQLAFVKNDLENTDTSKLIVIAFHIPLKGRSFRAEDRVQLFSYLKGHPHVLMLSGHTHIQQQIYYTKEDGWLQEKPLHEYNAGTTSGDWYSGELNDNNVPFATMRDGTEKGYAFLNVDGNSYTIDYKVAGKAPAYQMNIFAPRVIAHRRDEKADFFVNFFMGAKDSKLEYRIDEGDWTIMKREEAVDPAYYERFRRWDLTDALMPGRRPSGAIISSHLWKGSVSTELPVGIYTLHIRATDPFGRVFISEQQLRVEEPKPLPAVK